MILELSDSDFERLLKLAYLGEIVMNDWTPTEAWSEEQRASSDLVLDLQARAADSAAADLVGQDTRTGEWVPSPLLRSEMEAYIERYDDETFWDELVHRLARRDLAKEYSPEALSQMSDAHVAEAEKSLVDYYNDEVDLHELDRFVVDEKNGDVGIQNFE